MKYKTITEEMIACGKDCERLNKKYPNVCILMYTDETTLKDLLKYSD